METPVISIIVPVYKAENYLCRCVDSILAQTFSDFEVLLIDDGSPDKSGEICDAYAQRDGRVRVIHKENGGVSSARQCGIDNARGEYTIHADPDDWVEPTMLEDLYSKAKEDDADIVICDYWEEVAGAVRKKVQKPTGFSRDALLSDILNQRLHGSCWNKLIRRSCFADVKFPEGLNFSEDAFVCLNIIHKGVRVVYWGKAYYHYCWDTNPGSILKSSQRRLYNQTLLFLDKIKSICPVAEFPEGYAVQYSDLAIRAFCSNIYGTSEFRKLIESWEHEYAFKTKLPKRWRILFLLSTDFYLYRIIRMLIDKRRKLKNI